MSDDVGVVETKRAKIKSADLPGKAGILQNLELALVTVQACGRIGGTFLPGIESLSQQPQNTLLAMLPETSRRALPPLEAIMLQSGMVLYEPDEAVEYLYFPD